MNNLLIFGLVSAGYFTFWLLICTQREIDLQPGGIAIVFGVGAPVSLLFGGISFFGVKWLLAEGGWDMGVVL